MNGDSEGQAKRRERELLLDLNQHQVFDASPDPETAIPRLKGLTPIFQSNFASAIIRLLSNPKNIETPFRDLILRAVDEALALHYVDDSDSKEAKDFESLHLRSVLVYGYITQRFASQIMRENQTDFYPLLVELELGNLSIPARFVFPRTLRQKETVGDEVLARLERLEIIRRTTDSETGNSRWVFVDKFWDETVQRAQEIYLRAPSFKMSAILRQAAVDTLVKYHKRHHEQVRDKDLALEKLALELIAPDNFFESIM